VLDAFSNARSPLLVSFEHLLRMKSTLLDLCKGAEFKDWLRDQKEKVKAESANLQASSKTKLTNSGNK